MANTMFLLSLSIDRRKAIVRPLAPKNGRTCVMVSLVAIWLTSAALASEPLSGIGSGSSRPSTRALALFRNLCKVPR